MNLSPVCRGILKKFKICLPTIMHTGNHLAQQHIFKGFTQCPHVAIKEAEGLSLITSHVIDDVMDRWWTSLPHADVVFTTLRHPARVMESFRRRGRSLKAGDRQYDEGCNFESQWKNLIEISKEYEINYIHIDLPDRDKYVEKASSVLGIDLGKGWPVLGEQQGTKDLEITDELINQVPDFIMGFYEKTHLSSA